MAASTLSPHGLAPLRRLDGAMWGGNLSTYRILGAYATSIFTGDLVKLASDGTIQRCATAEIPVGLFMGCQYVGSDGKVVKSPYWPASTALLGTTASAANMEAYVMDDPFVTMIGQFSNGGASETGSHANTDVGGLFNIFFAAGSTATGLSGSSVDFATVSTGTAFSTASPKVLRLLRFVDRVDNDPLAGNARAEFAFSQHAYLTIGAGV